MKHYIDIENLRDSDVLLNGQITRARNDLCFRSGDLFQLLKNLMGLMHLLHTRMA